MAGRRRNQRRERTAGLIAGLACVAALALAPSASAGLAQIDLSDANRCDFISKPVDQPCLMPFPDNYYTVRDKHTATGRRVNLRTDAMPTNVGGTHIDAAPYNLNDGFSPGQPIVLKVPGLDSVAAMDATGAAPINHIGQFKRRRAPIVLLDAKTGKRAPIWAEIDSNATTPEDTAVEIHPATNLKAKHRYIVAMRHLKTAGGSEIPAPDAFRYYRDDVHSDQGPIEERRGHFENIFRKLKHAHIARNSLYLAWDFTVASQQNIAARVLHMRDDAFAQLGDTKLGDETVQGDPPKFKVTEVKNLSPAENPDIGREVNGTVTVPCYLAPSCAPGGRFQLDANGLPPQHGTWDANFECIVPRSTLRPDSPAARPIVYGHGLFGDAGEVHSDLLEGFANAHNSILCATDEIGMSQSDLPNTFTMLQDLSSFPELADRLQQGLLDELYLGRAMVHPYGFGTDNAFRTANGAYYGGSVINTAHLYYNGNSQGGIMGGALTAIAPDFTRAALGVPAMRYSMLLPRSVDYDAFSAVLYPNYPDELARPLGLSLIQMLWDRGEPNGYARRMTERPLPDTPEHRVFMAVAFGDHQVTNWAADIEARSIGASAHKPILDPGRFPGVDKLWNVPRIKSYPFKGSAIVYSDIGPIRADPANPGETIGVAPPPLENLANRAGEDPHGAPRGITSVSEMINQFLSPGGKFTDTCGGKPCYAGGYTGP